MVYFDKYYKWRKEAAKGSFESYSKEKLSPGKFGIMEYGTEKSRIYGVLSNLLYGNESYQGWFYPFTGGCIGFDPETGMRQKDCKVIAIEEIAETEAAVRYRAFLRTKKRKEAQRIDKEKDMRIYLCRMGRLYGWPCLNETKREVNIPPDIWNCICENSLFEELLVEGELQLLAEDMDGYEILSAFLETHQARIYLEKLFNHLHVWEDINAIFPSIEDDRYYIGIDFFKLNK